LKIIAVIQARMGSRRLRNKALRPIAGRCAIEWIAKRLRACRTLDGIVLSTSRRAENDRLAAFGRTIRLPVYRGSEQDLVSRLLGTARRFRAQAIVRVTGDCPLVDPPLVDQMVSLYKKRHAAVDFLTNTFPPTYPDGLDLDILPRKTLEKLDREVQSPLYREWLTTYILENPRHFRIVNLQAPKNRSSLRWTLDYPEDFLFLGKVLGSAASGGPDFTMDRILEVLRKHPAWSRLNQARLDTTIVRGIRSHAYHTLLRNEKILTGGRR
jgi:spore coat polysaccharide biosynthesis protein SpsF (cytidylyltransferase family)